MSSIRAGLIGCGVMGAHYARALAGWRDVSLAAVCDTSEQRVTQFSDEWRVPTRFASHRDMLDAGGLDAVIVATPDFAHREPVCDLLDSGLPVLCEKPLATTMADADAIVQAQERSALPVMINFGNRHRGNTRNIRQLIGDGALGDVEHVYVRLNERLCKTKTISWIERTSPVWFLLSHCVDLVRWLLDDAFERVYARAAHGVVSEFAPGVPDVVSALCTMESGVLVNLESSWIMPDAYFENIDFALQIIGTQGAIQADLFPHDLRLHQHTQAMAQDYSMGVQLPFDRATGWWEDSTRTFFEALIAGECPAPTAEEGREVTRTLLALDRSLSEARDVSVMDG